MSQTVRQLVMISLVATILGAITSAGLITTFKIQEFMQEDAAIDEAAQNTNFTPHAGSYQSNKTRQILRMDPALMKRYGLMPSKTPTPVLQTPSSTNPVIQMDPKLMRCYGLVPKTPAAQN